MLPGISEIEPFIFYFNMLTNDFEQFDANINELQNTLGKSSLFNMFIHEYHVN